MLDKIGTLEHAGIDATDLKQLDSACGIDTINSVTEIQDGVNASALLHTDTQDYFLKLQTFNRENTNTFSAQPFILQYFQDNSTPFSTPTPVAYDYTQGKLPERWLVTEAINGDTLSLDANNITPEVAGTVGRILGQVNSVQAAGYGPPTAPTTDDAATSITGTLPFNSNNSWGKAFKQFINHLLNTMAPRFYDLREPLESYVETVSVRSITPSLLHFDYWWENILWDEHNTPHVIDWERAFGGDPLANLYLSKHYLFDTLTIDSNQYSSSFYNEDRRTLQQEFSEAYKRTYTGDAPLAVDDHVDALYRVFPYIRELRGFPYWWRNETDEFKNKRAEALRATLTSYIN